MGRGIGALTKLVISIIVICTICGFLGITWADVDNFIDNGMMRAARLLGLLHGAAHQPLL